MAPPVDANHYDAAMSPEPHDGAMPGVPRKEDERLVTGRGRFVSDLQLPHMRHVCFVRSEMAHATIRGIDTAESRTVPGVFDVYTAASDGFAGMALRAASALPGYIETAQPILAAGKARFVGEAIAAVVARDRYAAEDGAEAVLVDYEPLRATVDARHEPVDPVHDEAPDNVLLSRTFAAGDIDAALAGAAVVVERELSTNRHGGNPMEGRAGVALWQDRNHLTLWCGTQIPHLVRNLLAECLQLPEGNIRVVAPDVGGGFGVKAVLYPEDVGAVPGGPPADRHPAQMGRGPRRAPPGRHPRAPSPST